MAFGPFLIAVQAAAATMNVGATVVRSDQIARPSVAVERGAVRIANAGPAAVTTARDGDRIVVTLTY
ncbi:MAG TPA: hypothetical protein VGW40_07985 [Allosphingosinicella sp.]|nr:hypothetical protein [Allosphingosinicella sp.]